MTYLRSIKAIMPRRRQMLWKSYAFFFAASCPGHPLRWKVALLLKGVFTPHVLQLGTSP